ncbi:MAG: hypothetical protein HFE86_00460, partial [Clostridiales bacterium]|nr:hypothetical protein [Clostridiales bacterium]
EYVLESASGNTDNCAPVKTWGYGGAPNQKWVFGKAESYVAGKEAKYSNFYLYDFDGDFCIVPSINMKFSISYTNAATNKYTHKIVTEVRTSQFEPNIFGNRITAAHVYNNINGDLDRSGQYRSQSSQSASEVYYLFENQRNKLYKSPLTVDTRWQVGNAAFDAPPHVFSQVFTFS